jgi:hypothetical protein
MTAKEALTMVAIASIIFRGLADGDLVYALDIHGLHGHRHQMKLNV